MLKKSKNEKKRRKLIALPLFFSAILFMTTSFAWFSANRVVSIDTLDVHIQADGGLEVSTDAINWKQVVTENDITSAHSTYPSSVNQIPARLYPVSTGGNITNGFMELFKGEATNSSGTNFILVAAKSQETESFGEDSDGTFIAFDVFFRVKSPKDLYLASKSEVKYLGDSGSGIENATRVAFLNEGTTGDNVSSAQSLKGASKASIWEPNYDVHTQYGVSHASSVYGISTTQTGGSLLPYSGTIADIRAADNVLISSANSSTYPSKFKAMNIDFPTKKNNVTNNKVLTLNPSVTKVRIYMWVEGQDVDCEDNSSYGDIRFALEFTTNPS